MIRLHLLCEVLTIKRSQLKKTGRARSEWRGNCPNDADVYQVFSLFANFFTKGGISLRTFAALGVLCGKKGL
jgi:hypothetical protein